MMIPKPDNNDVDLLMAKSKSALMPIPVARLIAFCKRSQFDGVLNLNRNSNNHFG
jgi:hypothetical protein